jgi:hypothetical protein
VHMGNMYTTFPLYYLYYFVVNLPLTATFLLSWPTTCTVPPLTGSTISLGV